MNAPQVETRRNNPFTLIELLVVIAIIAVLMGLLFPAISLVRNNAKITKAKAEMNAIVLAIKSYESTYGILPGSGADWTALDNDDYDILMQILTKVNQTGGTAQASKANLGNIRNVAFLDAPATFATKGYLDPWGSRYVILMDLDYDNSITISGGETLNGTVFAYCYGPDLGDDKGKDKKMGSGNDDIASWR